MPIESELNKTDMRLKKKNENEETNEQARKVE
jgi:hypothetical protein